MKTTGVAAALAAALIIACISGCAGSVSGNTGQKLIPISEDRIMGVGNSERTLMATVSDTVGLTASIIDTDRTKGIFANLSKDDSPSLAAMHGKRGILAFFEDDTGIPHFVLTEKEAHRLGLTLNDNGSGEIYLRSNKEKITEEEGAINLRFRDAGGVQRPEIELRPSGREVAVKVFCDGSGLPRIELLNRSGEPRIILGVDEKGSGYLKILDENGIERKI